MKHFVYASLARTIRTYNRSVSSVVMNIAISAEDLGFDFRVAYFGMVPQKKTGLDRNEYE